MTDDIRDNNHIHVWTGSIDGAEFGNALYEDDVDAALNYLAILKNLTKYQIDNESITIEDVMNAMDGDSVGMAAGSPGLIVYISRCSGGCTSPVWN